MSSPTGQATELHPSDMGMELLLALDDTHVYFVRSDAALSNTSTISRVPRAGGAASKLVETARTSFLHVDAEHLYFYHFGGALERMPKAGGSVTEVLPSPKKRSGIGPFVLESLATDDDTIYWAEKPRLDQKFRIRRMPRAGGEVTTLCEDVDGYPALTLGKDHIYFVQRKPKAGILRIRKSGGTTETIVEGSVQSYGVRDGRLVWINDVDVVLAQPESGGPRTWVAHAGQSAMALSLGTSKVFWSDDSTVEAAPIGGGDVELVAEESGGHIGIISLVAQGDGVYWIGRDAAIRGRSW